MSSTSLRLSDPSESIDDVDIPEVTGQTSSFVYNYYLKDERVSDNSYGSLGPSAGLDKIARYVTVSWRKPPLSFNGYQERTLSSGKTFGIVSIEEADSKGLIMSEDNYFNLGYLNHTFSNVSAIEQGASDLENFTRMSSFDAESMLKMANFQVRRIASQTSNSSVESKAQSLVSISDSYKTLSDFPRTALGLRVYNSEGKLSDNDDLLRSIIESLTLNIKLNNSVISDIFSESVQKSQEDLQTMSVSYENSVQGITAGSTPGNPLRPVFIDSPGGEDFGNSVEIIGYTVDKYFYDNGSFKKINRFYLEGADNTVVNDTAVSYGKNYVYVIKTIASLKMFLYESNTSSVKKALVYVSSRGSATKIQTIENVPPPEPSDIRFYFDYKKRSLSVTWKSPVNPQRDIKQFQVFRRASIKHPFELIAQYGFDDTIPGPGGQRFKTSEVVDANNLQQMKPELRYLVKNSEVIVNEHVDLDFVVDPEFYTSSEYIYAICSVDAHGMISNYSTQYRVTFDSYKNKLVVSTVCASGCPKQYPNLKLNVDTFKDVISVSGDNSRSLSVYFTPEYLKLTDSRRNATLKVVEAKTPIDRNPYYVLQMINLDNQKMQLVKINIEDSSGLTTL